MLLPVGSSHSQRKTSFVGLCFCFGLTLYDILDCFYNVGPKMCRYTEHKN
uniref:Uncharacterized protein n=1 Tax=Solanum lycopersicum TaxID=4081 RepID=A0A3Q7I4X4_SOLLC